jgi:hypothetical protein
MSGTGTTLPSGFRLERSAQDSKAVTPPNFRLGQIWLYHPRGSSVGLNGQAARDQRLQVGTL